MPDPQPAPASPNPKPEPFKLDPSIPRLTAEEYLGPVVGKIPGAVEAFKAIANAVDAKDATAFELTSGGEVIGIALKDPDLIAMAMANGKPKVYVDIGSLEAKDPSPQPTS